MAVVNVMIVMTKVRGKVIKVKFIIVEDLIWGIDILLISVMNEKILTTGKILVVTMMMMLKLLMASVLTMLPIVKRACRQTEGWPLFQK